MKNKVSRFFITTLLLGFMNLAYGFDTVEDYTGEAFFEPASTNTPKFSGAPSPNESSESKHTVPPIKQLRQKLKARSLERAQSSLELAPTASDLYAGEIETSEYASKEIEDEFTEMQADGFES